METNLIPLVEIVNRKRGENKEFFINFFERCNLNCSFCWQDHDDWTGVDDIVQKAQTVITNAKVPAHYAVNVMGGELFMDDLPDRVFDDYVEFCRLVHEAVPEYTINFVTNLVFNNTGRILRLIKALEVLGVNFTLCTSYDPAGRFNKETLAIFEENLVIFKPWLSNISVVLTKPNIKRFMNGTNETFDRLYVQYPIFFDYYSPEANAAKLQPSDEEIADFFLWLDEFYPESQPIKSFRENVQNDATCRSSFIILPTGATGSCRILADKTQFKSDPVVEDNIHESEARFLEQFDCLSCEWYSKCGLGCFLHSDHISITTSTCQFKRMFEELSCR